ncbi:MAG: sterol desaturase family protein [Chitinophagales bacterium]|nr:sterol desaturase family protein [Chitinophagales bacterium]
MSWSDLLNDNATQVIGAILGIVFISCILLEYLMSWWLKKNYVRSEYLIINVSVAFLQQLTDFVNKGVFILAFVYVQKNWSVLQWLELTEIKAVNPFSPFSPLMIFNYFMVLVIADFCQYWLHRFSHEINILWAGHVTHHSNEEYNLGVAVRQNALEGIYTWVFFLPLAFLGIPWQMFVTAYAVSLLWQFLVHTQWIKKLGWLEHVMSTPSHHRVHHGRNAQYIDKNYGAFFIVWDKLFGTFEPEVEAVDYGITAPLQSQNPLWSNIHHHIDIARRVWHAQTLREKAKWLFGLPSKIYTNENVNAAQETSFTLLPLKKLYVFLNTVFVAVGAFYVLNYCVERSIWIGFIGMGAFVVVCFSIFTGLLEQKKWADYAEVMRLLLIGTLGGGLVASTEVLGIALVLSAIFMMCLTVFVASEYTKETKNVTF